MLMKSILIYINYINELGCELFQLLYPSLYIGCTDSCYLVMHTRTYI